MDIQQKRDEMQYADLKEFRNRKALAGEDLIKGYTLYLQALEARKALYQHLLERPGDPETFARKTTKYTANIQKMKEHLGPSDWGVLSKYVMYFADSEKPAIMADAGKLLERDEAIRHRLGEIDDQAHHLHESLKEGVLETPEAHTGFRAIAASLANEKNTLLTEAIAIAEQHLQAVHAIITQIQEDISGKKR